ncbi:MAG: helix-turn-helix transcriptional regulator [Clostridiaceae bacterium]|jgi:transcriptional regulator with XRE-family HTH domain|nr:helix-turn-helix transcriptional regulator [Clostridiaceae bacterium]
MSRIGSEISRLRKEAGMTQKQLGKLVGVTERFIDEVESGKKVMNSDLIARVSKVLRQEAGNLELYSEEEIRSRPEPDMKVKKVIEKPVQQIWTDALAGVIMTVPVYDYKMDKAVAAKQLPIISNKVEGCPKDKVFYLQVEDDEMSGFRIMKGDLVLAFSSNEIEKDAFYFMELKGRKMIRQIRVLDSNRLLLVGNSGKVTTETVLTKEANLIARLLRLEIKL